MGNSFRAQPLPTRYPSMRTPVTEDTLQVGLLYAFGIIALCFILIIPGIRGWERLWASIRVFCALWIGAVILVCNFGSWYADSICTTTQYKAHTKPNTRQFIDATVGISIGLRGFNVTLKEREDGCEGSVGYTSPFPGEMINYVERFRWAPSWRQGRLDFGIYGAQLYQEYRAAKYRGMPYPITWVAEYFLLDGEQVLWYRKFRIAGWYTHIFMWLAFATYLLSILLFIYDVRHGACYMLITGLILLLATLTYGVLIRNDPPFRIPFPDAVLWPKFSYSFYLTVSTGGATVFLALVLLLVDYINPRKTAAFFHHSYIEDDTMFEGEVVEEEELQTEFRNRSSSKGAEGGVRRRKTRNHSQRTSARNSRTSVRRSNVFPRPASSASISMNPGFEALTPTHEEDESAEKRAVEVEVDVETAGDGRNMEDVTRREEKGEVMAQEQTDMEQDKGVGVEDEDGFVENDSAMLTEMTEEKGPEKGIEMEMVTIQIAQGET